MLHLSLFILIQKRNIVLLKTQRKRIGLCPLGQNKLEYYGYNGYKPTVYLFEGRGGWFTANNKNKHLRKQESQSLSLCIGCDIVMQLIY
jgi:hypothetical protein